MELLARVLVFLGDSEAEKILPYVADEGVSRFLRGKIYILQGEKGRAVEALSSAAKLLRGDDLLEADLLTAFLLEDIRMLERISRKTDFSHPRFKPYAVPVFLRLADLLYAGGRHREALSYYREVVRRVVNRAKDKDNIWSRVIVTLWEG